MRLLKCVLPFLLLFTLGFSFFFFNNDIQIHRLHTQLLTNNKKIHKTGTH